MPVLFKPQIQISISKATGTPMLMLGTQSFASAAVFKLSHSFASLGNEIVIGIDDEKCGDLLVTAAPTLRSDRLGGVGCNESVWGFPGIIR
jgi:hypothetical protein